MVWCFRQKEGRGARMQAYVNSIYLATEGEGIHIGTPQVFVRFQGCHIGCFNCDSQDTWAFEESSITTLEEVLQEVFRLSGEGQIRRVSITGGDPLHPKNISAVLALIKALKEKRYWVNLEAAGTRLVHEVFDILDFISFDFKTPSTGVVTKIENLIELVDQYSGKFQIKSVVETDADFERAFDKYQELCKAKPKAFFPWCLTPCYNPGENFPRERFQRVLELNCAAGGPFRVIGQQHKWIFGAEKKRV